MAHRCNRLTSEMASRPARAVVSPLAVPSQPGDSPSYIMAVSHISGNTVSSSIGTANISVKTAT